MVCVCQLRKTVSVPHSVPETRQFFVERAAWARCGAGLTVRGAMGASECNSGFSPAEPGAI